MVIVVGLALLAVLVLFLLWSIRLAIKLCREIWLPRPNQPYTDAYVPEGLIGCGGIDWMHLLFALTRWPCGVCVIGMPEQSPESEPRMLFPLGQVVATRGAVETMARRGIQPDELLARDVTGDWGDLDDEDKLANNQAVDNEARILSIYGPESDPDRLYVITEWDRSVTTILRPDEY